MKIFLLPLFLALASTASAQLVVAAPDVSASVVTANSAQLAQWATAIAKYEDQILKQIEQIEKAEAMLKMQSTLLLRVGDWKTVASKARAIQLQAKNLTADFGVSWKVATFVDNGNGSLTYTGGRLFDVNLGVTEKGAPLVSEKRLRRYQAVENLYEDVNATFEKTEAPRKQILEEIAEVAAAIADSSTQAETDILLAKLEALKVALANVQSQRDEKMQRMLVQTALNANEREKEEVLKQTSATKNSSDHLSGLGNVKTGGASFR
jgi:hypothetical protein